VARIVINLRGKRKKDLKVQESRSSLLKRLLNIQELHLRPQIGVRSRRFLI
jgi:hypothetical protein